MVGSAPEARELLDDVRLGEQRAARGGRPVFHSTVVPRRDCLSTTSGDVRGSREAA